MVMYPLFIQPFTERELADLAEKIEMLISLRLIRIEGRTC